MAAMLTSPKGRTTLGAAPVAIGSANDNQLVLDDSSVDAHHAEIKLETDGYKVTDLGSKNGTFVNDERIGRRTAMTLHNGDTLRLGNVNLNYRETDEVSTVSGPLRDQTTYKTSYSRPDTNTTNTTKTSYSRPDTTARYERPVSVERPRSNWLWPLLGALAGLLLLGGLLSWMFMRNQNQNASTGSTGTTQNVTTPVNNTPTHLYQEFCTAVNAHNGADVFRLLGANYQQNFSQNEANLLANSASNCTASEINDQTGNAVLTYDFAPSGKIVANTTATLQNNTWKMESQHLGASPTASLFQYCNNIEKADYNAAYHQLTGGMQGGLSTEQLTNEFSGMGVTSCKLANNDDGASKGSIDYTTNNGQKVMNYELTDDNGVWKINKQTAA